MTSKSEAAADLRETVDRQTVEIGALRANEVSLESLISELQFTQGRADQLNQELELRNASLEGLNQELEAFSYAVSHDLRGPLRSIHGFAEALETRKAGLLDTEGISYLKRICDAASRMDRLIDDLLHLSRITRAQMRSEPVDLSAMATSIADELTERPPTRVVDWRIAAGLRTHGDPVLMRVAYASKLFTPFQRLHSARQFTGSGIGLALAARAVARHGGKICAEGAVDSGATFRFMIPTLEA